MSVRMHIQPLVLLSGLEIHSCCKLQCIAGIWCCHGCDIGRQLQPRFNTYPGNFHMPHMWPLKKKRQKPYFQWIFLGQSYFKHELKFMLMKSWITLNLRVWRQWSFIPQGWVRTFYLKPENLCTFSKLLVPKNLKIFSISHY